MARWSDRSRSFLEALVLAAALVAMSAVPAIPAAAASPALSFPAFFSGQTDNITLYGKAGTGWGFEQNNTTTPGPHLYVGLGDLVQLTLISADGGVHNWFIDYANATQPSGTDPSSPDFGPTNAIVWSFNATTAGTYWYRCKYHFNVMVGLITIAPPTHYTLYGDTVKGWGFTLGSITKPGPTLVIEPGINVTLTLYSADNATHTWFIDLDNSTSVGLDERESPAFGGTSFGNPINWTFQAARSGTFAYRCGIHLISMWGMIVVLGTPGPAPARLPIGLIPGIMLTVIVGVLLLALVYQVRAVRVARVKK